LAPLLQEYTTIGMLSERRLNVFDVNLDYYAYLYSTDVAGAARDDRNALHIRRA
jgi:hypothetical protein